MYHISDIKQFKKCPKYYQLNKNNNTSFFNFFRNEYNMTDIYKKFFNIDDCFIGKTGDDPSLVLKHINDYEYFVNARFAYEDIRIKAPLLHKTNNTFSLYLFKPMLPKELDLDSFYITFDVLKKNNIHVDDINLIYVDRNYKLGDNIDFNKALVATDMFNDTKIIDLISNYELDYLSIAKSINNNANIDSKLDRHCTSCEYFDTCFNSIKDNSILNLVSSKYKYDMYLDGILNLKDADLNRIDATSLQYAQIIADKNNGQYIDKPRLKEFIDSFKSNIISFIDFEWDCFLFPIYKNMNCFGLLPFEYSLYIKNGDDVTNYNYVGKGDCREEFIESLLSKLPNEGPIVAYNSFSAEVLRLNELAEQFPKYKDKLKSIADRFIDIAEVFSKGMLYDIRFKGQLSLKSIDNVLFNVSYSKLDVHNGLDAIVNFRKYEEDGKEDTKNSLIEYCKQDAYSLVLLYNYLINLI